MVRRRSVNVAEESHVHEDSDARDSSSGLGDAEASKGNALLFEKHARDLELFFYNKLGSHQDRTDLLQETFRRFFDRAGKVKPESPARFLYGIANNVLREYWRGRDRSRRIEELGEQTVADLSQPSEPRSSTERKALVRELLRELPLNQQMVLELHYWRGKPYREIAELLDIPLGTATTWGYFGRRHLEKRLLEIQRLDERGAQEAGQAIVPVAPRGVEAFKWYDSSTGAIDLARLAAEAMVGVRSAALPDERPMWIEGLSLPEALPGATSEELTEIAKAAWQAWSDAGRPQP